LNRSVIFDHFVILLGFWFTCDSPLNMGLHVFNRFQWLDVRHSSHFKINGGSADKIKGVRMWEPLSFLQRANK